MIVLQGESRSAVIPKQNQSAHETRFGKKVFRGDRLGQKRRVCEPICREVEYASLTVSDY